jgi:transcriptional regulator with XRE-family HTH domain
MTEVEALGKVIVALRKRHRFNQKQLAIAAKLSKAHVNKLESGKQSTVRLGVLSRIAMAFGLTLADLTFLIEQRLNRPKRSR